LASPVGNAAWLTPLGVLLAPSVALPDHFGSIYIPCQEHFGLQIGWPILVAVGLAAYAVRLPASRPGGRRAVLVRLLVLFALAAPNIGRGGACAYFRPGARCLLAASEVHPDVNWVGAETGGLLETLLYLRQGTVWAVLPTPAAGDTLHVQGTAAAPVRLTVAV